MVTDGQIVGHVHEPANGQDGIDIFGRTIAAKPGNPVSLKLDKSVALSGDGRLVAKSTGALRRSNAEIGIQELLEIPGDVDFSTGNIDFGGDVLIKGGVGDRFGVRATGDIEIHGLVEGAQIRCGGTLIAKSGVAGWGSGRVEVAADLIARFLNHVCGVVKRDLLVEREVINCELIIRGGAHIPSGAVIGGTLEVAGALEVAALGSNGGAATRVVATEGGQFDLFVSDHLHAGVQLTVGQQSFYFSDHVRGPLRALGNSDGSISCRLGSDVPRPLCELPGVSSVARTR